MRVFVVYYKTMNYSRMSLLFICLFILLLTCMFVCVVCVVVVVVVVVTSTHNICRCYTLFF